MKSTEVFQLELESMNERLEDALIVISAVDGSDDLKHSYPYGVGYSKGAIKETLLKIRSMIDRCDLVE